MRDSYAAHTAKAELKSDLRHQHAASSRSHHVLTLKKSSRAEVIVPLKYQSALQHSYRLLAYRGRSEKELRERLKRKGFDKQAIDAAISSLTSNGFLDDRKLASSLKRYAEESKHYGISGIRRFLRVRGIPGDIIDATVKDIDETEIARKIIEKKMRGMRGYAPEKTARRLYGILYRRGYSPETIIKALEHLAGKEDFS